MQTLFLAITGSALLTFFIWIVIAGIIYWLLSWLLGQIGLPEPFGKIARIVLAIVAVIVVINALLTLVGKPFIVI